jgi:hypothetical protein
MTAIKALETSGSNGESQLSGDMHRLALRFVAVLRWLIRSAFRTPPTRDSVRESTIAARATRDRRRLPKSAVIASSDGMVIQIRRFHGSLVNRGLDSSPRYAYFPSGQPASFP